MNIDKHFEAGLKRGPSWVANWINHYALIDFGESKIVEAKETKSIYVKSKHGYVRISNHMENGKPHVAHILFNQHIKPNLNAVRKAYIALRHNAFSYRRVRELVEKQNLEKSRSLHSRQALKELAGF